MDSLLPVPFALYIFQTLNIAKMRVFLRGDQWVAERGAAQSTSNRALTHLIPGGFSYSLRPVFWIRIGSGSSILFRWEFFNLNPGLVIARISLSHVFLLVEKQLSRGTGLFCYFNLLYPFPDVRYLAWADPDPGELHQMRIYPAVLRNRNLLGLTKVACCRIHRSISGGGGGGGSMNSATGLKQL